MASSVRRGSSGKASPARANTGSLTGITSQWATALRYPDQARSRASGLRSWEAASRRRVRLTSVEVRPGQRSSRAWASARSMTEAGRRVAGARYTSAWLGRPRVSRPRSTRTFSFCSRALCAAPWNEGSRISATTRPRSVIRISVKDPVWAQRSLARALLKIASRLPSGSATTENEPVSGISCGPETTRPPADPMRWPAAAKSSTST